MSPEDFRNIAQGIQAILISLAALGGALWALFRFSLTKEQQRSRYELEKLRAEAEKSGGVSCDIKISHQKIDKSRYHVNVEFTLLNHGMSLVTYRCDDFPFHINKISMIEKEVYFTEIARSRIQEASADDDTFARWLTAITIKPGTPKTIALFYELDSPATYNFALLLGSEKFMPKSEEDKECVERANEIYQEHKDHPQYIENMPSMAVFSKYYLVSE